jgi:uncharacterized membrane protein
LQLAGCPRGDCTQTLGDVPKVFELRGVRIDHPPYFDRMVEYPVVTGAVIYAAAIVGRDPRSFMIATAAVSALLALAVSLLLARMAPARVLRWAVALPLILYGAHNWDLVAIAPLVGALYAFDRHADKTAGTLVAVGASAKLFPGLLLPVFFLLRRRERDAAGARRFALSAIATGAVLNLPVFLLAPHGWLWPFRFQAGRPATWATPWFYLLRQPGLRELLNIRDPRIGTMISVVSLTAGMVILCVWAVRTNASAVGLAAAATGVFLLSGKIYSPGYDLWLVPFFVLLPLSRRHWLAFCAVDLGIYITTYGMLHSELDRSYVRLLGLLVFIRFAIIVVFVVRAVTDRTAAVPVTAGKSSSVPVPVSG